MVFVVVAVAVISFAIELGFVFVFGNLGSGCEG